MRKENSLSKKAVFLDRDGVLNEDIGFLFEDDLVVYKEIKPYLKKLKDKGFYLIVISNQPVIARGLVSEREVEQINYKVNSELGNLIDAFYFCPHHPNATLKQYRKICECRKPSNGLILRSFKDFDIHLNKSWMIGDMISDIVCGKRSGCKTILLKSKNNSKIIESGEKWEKLEPDFFCEDFSEASKIILNK